MERFAVVFRPQALTDIEAILLYVLEVSRSVQTASAFTDRIYARCERIGDAPHGGVAREDLGSGIRLVPFEKRAVILYRLEGHAVVIVNIFYGGRDYAALMQGETD